MVIQRSPLPRPLLLVAIFCLITGIPSAITRGAPATAAVTTELTPAAAGRLLFIENAGQWPDAARFQVWGGGQTLWLAEDGLWLTVFGEGEASPEDLAADQTPWTDDRSVPERESHGMPRPDNPGVNIRLSFPGANPHPVLESFDRLETHVSYFIGAEPDKWRADVPVWGGVRYADLYPGVDLEFTGTGGQWQWQLAPSPIAAGVSRGITLRVEGAAAVAVEGEALRLSTALGDISVPLLTLERANAERANVDRLNAQAFDVTIPFALTHANSQSADQDPQARDLLYGTFLGGKYHDHGLALAVDPAGSAYVTGYTESTDFPVTPGALDTNNNHDAFMAKLDPAGSGLAYATFLGGNGWDVGKAIAVDVAGSTYMAGFTFSRDFPATPGAFATLCNCVGGDAFVVKLDPVGNALLYSTFLGGGGADGAAGIAVDATGSAYVTGGTYSSDFPVTPDAFDTSFNGYLEDAFVVQLDPAGSTLHYSTFLGGSGDDYATGIAVDATGSAYTTGYTESADFPVTPGAFDTSFNGGYGRYGDAFAVKLHPVGNGLVYATFLGGSSNGWDRGDGIAIDAAGCAYVTGEAYSSDFPVTPGAFDMSHNGVSDAFVAKLNLAGNRLTYATFLGGRGADRGFAIAVDVRGHAYVTGATLSTDFSITPGAFDTSYNGGTDYGDSFVVKLDPAGSEVLYGTFLGGRDDDNGYGIAVDESASAYVTGITESTDFPVTPGTLDTSYTGPYPDAFVAKLSATYPPIILGTVWHDEDGDAERSAGEPGIAGVQVCAEPLGHRAVRCTTSGADGNYAIELNAAGTYLVAPAAAPAGMQLTTQGFRLPIVVRQGQQAQNVNFGYR